MSDGVFVIPPTATSSAGSDRVPTAPKACAAPVPGQQKEQDHAHAGSATSDLTSDIYAYGQGGQTSASTTPAAKPAIVRPTAALTAADTSTASAASSADTMLDEGGCEGPQAAHDDLIAERHWGCTQRYRTPEDAYDNGTFFANRWEGDDVF